MASWGVHGAVKVKVFATDPAVLFGRSHWWVSGSGEPADWREVRLLSGRPHGEVWLVELDGLANREQARAWRGALIAVPRSDLPAAAPGEYYQVDLIGFSVVGSDGRLFGELSGFADSGSGSLMRVTRADVQDRNGRVRETLIPWVEPYVRAVDLPGRRVEVDWDPDF